MKANPEDFELDAYNLENEVSKQADLTFKYGKGFARAKAERDKIKIQIDIVRAEITAKVREDHDEYGIRNLNEGAVKTVVEGEPELVKWKKKLIIWQEQCDILYAASNAISAKREAITGQIRLYSMSYYSDQTAPAKSGAKSNKAISRRGRS